MSFGENGEHVRGDGLVSLKSLLTLKPNLKFIQPPFNEKPYMPPGHDLQLFSMAMGIVSTLEALLYVLWTFFVAKLLSQNFNQIRLVKSGGIAALHHF